MAKRKILAITCLVALVIGAAIAQAAGSLEIIINLEKGDKQSVLAGKIESLIIKRGPAEFRLGPGNVTLFDFGSGKPAAMTYKGTGSFTYIPPDEVEKYQLRKFTGKDTLSGAFDKAAFFFSVELEGLPDSAGLKRVAVEASMLDILNDAHEEVFDHRWVNITNKIIGDLLSPEAGTYFGAVFDLMGAGQMVFEEDPLNDDYYSLHKLVRYAGSEYAETWGGFSPDDGLITRRGVIPVDITNYAIETRIEAGGGMAVRCGIDFKPLRSGRQFVYFMWHFKNEIISAVGPHGDTLTVVRRLDRPGLLAIGEDEPGFGVVMPEPMELGKSYHIEINYKSKCLMQEYGNFYIRDKTLWYPRLPHLDYAIYDMLFDTPKPFEVVSCGDNKEFSVSGGRQLSRWVTPEPVQFVSFNLADFETKEVTLPDIPPVKAFASKTIPHDSVSLLLLAGYGISSNSDVAGRTATGVADALTFFSSILGPCPFDSIRASELYDLMAYDTARFHILSKSGQSSPGLVHLSWGSYQYNTVEGLDARLRAHEVSHQWWGHAVAVESYRDTWIIEGLAEYSGYWFYELAYKNRSACDRVLKDWRTRILGGASPESFGSKAGPPVMGYRLLSTQSNDYFNIVYEKGAYIFHMIRYLLHDYKTGSDDAFAAFLKDLAAKYKGRVITTDKLQRLLEEHAGQEMDWFFQQWVYGTEIPEYAFKSKVKETAEGKYLVTCQVRQEKAPGGFRMPVPVTVFFEDDRYVHIPVWVDRPETDIELPLLPYKPKEILFNTYDAVLCKVRYER